MDELDKRILSLLSTNARMTIKDIAQQVSLTSPAVSERIRKLEEEGVIQGYTVKLGRKMGSGAVKAVISMYVPPEARGEMLKTLENEPAIVDCYQVTGAFSHTLKAYCRDIEELDRLINRLQVLGKTNTQIVLSSLIDGDTSYLLNKECEWHGRVRSEADWQRGSEKGEI